MLSRLKKYFFRVVEVAVGLSMLTTFFSGCSEQATAVSNEPVTLQVETSFGEGDGSAADYANLLKEFMSANADITVLDNSVKADDKWKSLVRDTFEAGKEPDVLFFFTAADAKTMVDQNKVVAISEIKKLYPEYGENIKPTALEVVREHDGEIYALPVKGFYEGLYCNDSLFKKYDVPPITDWKSLENAIEIFNQNNIVPIAASFSDVPNYWIEHSILSVSGMEIHSKNPKTDSEIPKEWLQGIQLLKELYDKKAFQSDSLVTRNELAIKLFNEEKAAMILEGSWFKPSDTIDNNVSLAQVPFQDNVSKNERGIIGGFSMGFYITTKCFNDEAKRNAAVRYVEFMTSNQSNTELCKVGGFPANIDVSPESNISTSIKGIEFAKNHPLQMPIDSRLSKASWEYIVAKIPNILSEMEKAEDVFSTAISRNK